MPWIPVLGIVFQLLLTPFLLTSLGLSPWDNGFTALVTMGAWFALGIVVWFAYSEEKELEKLEEETPTVVTRQATERRDYQVVVPIANPETADQLVRTAIDLARENGGEILVMTVVTVPQQTPTSQGRQFVTEEQEQVINRAIELGEDAEVPASGTIRIGHDVVDAIVEQSSDFDLTVIGATREGLLEQLVFGAVPEAVGSRSENIVVMAKKNLGTTSLIGRR